MTCFDNRPIGVFDSGMGGLSVLACARALAPNEKFIYLADLKNSPYGERPIEKIRELVEDDVRVLMDKGVKAILVACNTATASSVRLLREKYDFPIVGIEPAVALAAKVCPGKTAVMATPATLSLSMFKSLAERYKDLIGIMPVPCPGLAAMVDGDSSFDEYRDYLYSRIDRDDPSVTSIVLGCTHYVLISEYIKKLYPDKMILSGNEGTVRNLIRILNERGLAANTDSRPGEPELLSTDESEFSLRRMKTTLDAAIRGRVWENG